MAASHNVQDVEAIHENTEEHYGVLSETRLSADNTTSQQNTDHNTEQHGETSQERLDHGTTSQDNQEISEAHMAVPGVAGVTESRQSAGPCIEDNRPKMMQAIVKALRKENIYKTKGVAATQEKILSQDCVCVVGVPGAGKSTAIQHAALDLEKKGFFIYVINEPNEFVNYFDDDKKQVFILDDVLGIYSLDQGKVKLWHDNNAGIRRVLGMNTKLLVSIRTQLYNQAVKGNNFVFLDKSTCIDFSDKTYRLDGTDMLGMLRHYLDVQGVDKVDDLIRQICCPWYTEKKLQNMTEGRRQQIISWDSNLGQEFSHCFPLLCQVFCSEKSVRHNPREFFTNPFQALTQIFQKIKSDNKLQFCGLALCTVFDGKLTEDMFSINCELDDELDKQSVTLRNVIMTSCDLEGHKYLPQIKSALNSLDRVYVSCVEKTYQISHRVFHDLVTYLFNDTDPSFVFKYGTSELIRDRIRLNQTQPIDDPYMIIINDNKNIDRLAHRLFTDLKSDIETGARFIAENVNIDDDRLFTRLRCKLLDREQTDKRMIEVLFGECICSTPQYKLIDFCLQNTDVDIVNITFDGDNPINLCVHFENLQLTKYLLHHGADKRRIDVLGYSVLHHILSNSNHRLEFIKLLTQDGDMSVVEFISSDRHRILQGIETFRGKRRLPQTLEDDSDRIVQGLRDHRTRHIILEEFAKDIERRSILKALDSDNLQLEEVLSDNSIKVLTTDKNEIKNYVEHSEGKMQLIKRVHDNILTYGDRQGRNILHYSVDNYVVTEYLLTHHCLQREINNRDVYNRTPYWYVVHNKKPNWFEDKEDVVVDEKQDMVNIYNKHGAVL